VPVHVRTCPGRPPSDLDGAAPTSGSAGICRLELHVSPRVDQVDEPRLMLLLQPLHDRRLAAAAVLGLAVHRTARAAVVTPLHEDVRAAVVHLPALVAATGGLDRGHADLGYHGRLRGGWLWAASSGSRSPPGSDRARGPVSAISPAACAGAAVGRVARHARPQARSR